jgi:hypothetical protein
MHELAAANDRVYLYDPYTALCPQRMCLIYDAKTDTLLYRDDNHITLEASLDLVPHFDQWLKETFSIEAESARR